MLSSSLLVGGIACEANLRAFRCLCGSSSRVYNVRSILSVILPLLCQRTRICYLNLDPKTREPRFVDFVPAARFRKNGDVQSLNGVCRTKRRAQKL